MKNPDTRDKQRRSGPPRRPGGGGNGAGKSAKIQAELFGLHPVRAAWLNPEREISALYITDNALPAFQDTLAGAARQGLKRPEPTSVSRAGLDKALPPGAVHQGVAVRCAPLPEIFVTDLIAGAMDAPGSCIIMLDQVTDPHNVGAILRSAAAFGCTGMIVQKKHAPALTGVLAKAASGAVEHVPVAYEINLSRALETLKEAGYKAIGLDERGEKLADIPHTPHKVLVLGAEGRGLRPKVAETCDLLARIPMDPDMPSLNVSNAAAIGLYSLSR